MDQRMSISVSESAAGVGVFTERFPNLPDPFGDEPIRGEPFALDQLKSNARQLARAAENARVSRGRPLLPRFADDGDVLRRAHRQIAEAYRRQENVGTDAEWLIDNFHIVADALHEIEVDLPGNY